MNGIEIIILVIIVIIIGRLIKKPNIRRAIKRTRRVKKKSGWHDPQLIERLTKHELKLRPQLSKKEARKLALERWERDMR